MKNDKTIQSYLKVLDEKDIDLLFQWTVSADVSTNELLRIYRKIKSIEPVETLTVYRGIGERLSLQDKMGLYRKKFMMNFLISEARPGYKFKYATHRPLSFTDDLATAKAFGNVIVTTQFTRDIPYIRITQALWEAANKIKAVSLFQEVILLDIGRNIWYTVYKT